MSRMEWVLICSAKSHVPSSTTSSPDNMGGGAKTFFFQRMKRARPLDDLNGIERPHKAKRSKPSFDRPPELGPITAILPEMRRVLFQFMDTQSLGRLASTCRGFAKDMMTAPSGGSPIVSISLGAKRDFLLKPNDGGKTMTVALAAGSMLTMEGTTQQYYKHSVPPRKRCKAPRINITFRHVVKKRARADDDGDEEGPPKKKKRTRVDM